jgi:hypothetical protein
MKRYDLFVHGGDHFSTSKRLIENENGEIVYFYDVTPIIAENEKLKKEIGELKKLVKYAKDRAMDFQERLSDIKGELHYLKNGGDTNGK